MSDYRLCRLSGSRGLAPTFFAGRPVPGRVFLSSLFPNSILAALVLGLAEWPASTRLLLTALLFRQQHADHPLVLVVGGVRFTWILDEPEPVPGVFYVFILHLGCFRSQVWDAPGQQIAGVAPGDDLRRGPVSGAAEIAPAFQVGNQVAILRDIEVGEFESLTWFARK